MVQVGVVLERVEPAADDVDAPVPCRAAHVVPRARQRLEQRPAVCARVVSLVPADAGALFFRRRSAADQVNSPVERNRARSAARPRKRRKRRPAVGGHVVSVRVADRVRVLIDETAQRIDPPGQGGHGDVVGPARQRGGRIPAVAGGIVDVVDGAIDPPLAVAADDVQPSRPGRGPCHLAARQGQGGPRRPAPGRPRQGRAFRHALRLLAGREVAGHRATLAEPGERLRRGTCRPQRGQRRRLRRGAPFPERRGGTEEHGLATAHVKHHGTFRHSGRLPHRSAEGERGREAWADHQGTATSGQGQAKPGAVTASRQTGPRPQPSPSL